MGVAVVLVVVLAAVAVAILAGVLGATLLVGAGGLAWWAVRSTSDALASWRARPVDDGPQHVMPTTYLPPAHSYNV